MFISAEASFALLGIGYLAIVAWPLVKTDFLEHRLPNKYVLPGFPITLIGQLAASAWTGLWPNMLIAVVAAIGTFLACLGLNRMAYLGMGDVKLMTLMAQLLGWFAIWLPLVWLAITFLIAGSVSLVMLIARRMRLGSAIALGPYLIVGFFATVTLGALS